MKKVFVAAAAGALLLYGSTVINGDRSIIGKWDASGATSTLPMQVGVAGNLPSTCTVGQMYFASDGAPGKKLQSCTETNTWTAVAYEQGTTAGKPVTCSVGQIYFATNATAGQNLYFCTAVNTWTQMAAPGVTGTAPYSCAATGVASVTCAHNLGTQQPWVACYDGSGNMLGSAEAATSVTSVIANSANTATITFSDVTTGNCVLSTGSMGPAGAAGPTGATGPAGGSGDAVVGGANTWSGYNDFHGGRLRLPEATFASAPGSAVTGQAFLFTDASTAGTCSGGGSSFSQCRWNGSSWDPIGGGGGGGGSSFYQRVIGSGPFGSGANNTLRTQRSALQARDNLSFDDDGTNTILNFNAVDARTVWLDEEFLSTSIGATSLGQLGWRMFNIAGSTLLQVAPSGDTWPNLGVFRFTTGAAAGNGVQVTLSNNASDSGHLGALGSNAGWGMVWIFRINSTAATRLQIGAGNVGPSVAVYDLANTMGVRYDTHSGFADTNFMFYMKAASGGDVTVDTGVAADTNFHTLFIYSNTAGTLNFQFDGGAVKTFCASSCDATVTVPTAAMDPFVNFETDTTTAKTIDLDAFKFKARVATGTANKRN